MNCSILTLLITPFVGAIATFFGRKINKKTGNIAGVVFTLLAILELFYYYNLRIDYLTYGSFLESPLILRINSLSWLILIIASSIFFLTFLFSIVDEDRKIDADFYFLEMLLLEGAVFGILLAGDLFTFFMFWEMMSILAYFLASKGTEYSKDASLKYLLMSFVGANLMLLATVIIFVTAHSFSFDEVSKAIMSRNPAFGITVFILFTIAFFIKASIMPLHTWVNETYAEAPSSISVVFASVLKKVGIYGFALFTFVIIGLNFFNSIFVRIFNNNLALYVIQWFAGFTIFFGTVLAITQEDAKKILAYSSIANSGYIVLALSLGTPLGVAGGLFQLLNHSIFKALLFFAVGAVIYRTGTKDLSELGGLIKKMPFSYLGVLVAIISLAGMPPMNGFVSKWMIYHALIDNKQPLLFVIAIVGSVGSFLYVYRLIHSIFLGSLPEKYENVKEAPFLMRIPIMILMLATFALGVFPGIALKSITKVEEFLGLKPVDFTLTGFPAGTALSSANYLIITLAFLIGFALAFLFFITLPKARRVSEHDNYAAGQVVTKDLKYNYSFGFYDFVERVVKPIKKFSADKIFENFTNFLKLIGDFMRRIYTGDLETYVSYLVVFLTILIFTVIIGRRIW